MLCSIHHFHSSIVLPFDCEQTAMLKESLSLYQKAIEAHPENLHAHYGAAVVLRKIGEPEKAVSQFLRVIWIASSAPEEDRSSVWAGSRPASVWENLAATYMRLGRFIEAESAYQNSLELEPDNRTFKEAIAKVGRITGGAGADAAGEFASPIASPEFAPSDRRSGAVGVEERKAS